MGQRVKVSTKLFQKAAGLAKLCAALPQDGDVLSHALIEVRENSISVTATSEYLAVTTRIPLAEPLPELIDLELSFLVSAIDLNNLLGVSESEDFSFVYDNVKHSLTTVTTDETLTLSTRGSHEWVDISERFVSTEESITVAKKLLKSVMTFNKFFLATHQDASMYLIEIRDGLAMSTDRSKIGFLASKELEGVSLRVPGGLVSIIDKTLDSLPDGAVTLSESEAYNLICSSSCEVETCFGFAKSTTSLPLTFDQVPLLEESDQIQVNVADMSKALSHLSVVAPKVDPRVKLSVLDPNLVLTILNQRGLESSSTIPSTRVKGDVAASVVLPLAVLIKALKRCSSEVCTLKFANTKYVKLHDQSEVDMYSVFPSLPSLKQ